MQTIQLLPGAAARAGFFARARARTSRPAGSSRWRSPPRSRRSRRRASCRRPTSASATAGATCPSRWRSARRGARADRAHAPGDRRRRAPPSDDVDRARDRDAPSSSRAPRRAGCVPSRVRHDRRHRRPRRLRGGGAAWLGDAAGLRAVPGPDEHLRRPRQPAAARAPLRVARDRLRARRRRARRRGSTPTPTTSSTSAAARTATRRCARSTWPGQARRAARRRRPRRGRASPSAAATSCSATPTSWATSGSRASGWSTSRPCASDGPRLIGNVAIEVELGGRPAVLAGFENHGGRTRLGAGARAARPRPARPRQQRAGRRSRASAAARTGRWWAPISTVRCCPRTRSSPTG